MRTIFFDIETGPLPETELAALMPPFDPAEVKTGNIKDPEKIAAKIAEAEANHKRDFMEKAALDPMSGRVVAIGILTVTPHPGPLPRAERERSGEFAVIGHDDEKQILFDFWQLCRSELAQSGRLAGFNIFQFDLPFLIRRSWKHRVPVPLGLRRGRYWNDELLDLREAWQLGDRMAKGSLDSIAKHLSVGEKNGDGANFAKLWVSDRKQAVAYLQNDVGLTQRIAGALGCV